MSLIIDTTKLESLVSDKESKGNAHELKVAAALNNVAQTFPEKTSAKDVNTFLARVMERASVRSVYPDAADESISDLAKALGKTWSATKVDQERKAFEDAKTLGLERDEIAFVSLRKPRRQAKSAAFLKALVAHAAELPTEERHAYVVAESQGFRVERTPEPPKSDEDRIIDLVARVLKNGMSAEFLRETVEAAIITFQDEAEAEAEAEELADAIESELVSA